MLAKDADATRSVGKQIADALTGGENLLLYGDLGAGKTTLVQGLAEGLGITEPVKSPTYAYLREYVIPLRSTRLAHFDLHRLPESSGAAELESIGLLDRLSDTDTLVVVEWAERLGEKADPFHRIRLEEMEDGRLIELPQALARRVAL